MNSDNIEKCPACNATYAGRENCHRCGTDILQLIRIREKSGEYCREALKSHASGDYENMYLLSKKAVSKFAGSLSLQILCRAAFLTGRFETALSIWEMLEKNKNHHPVNC